MFYQTVDYPAGSSFADKAYTYDAAGNRIPAFNGSTTNYTSNNLNQYIQAGNNSYTYDLNGNLTSDETNTYAYDYENRLISAAKSGTTAAYAYDSFGRRTSSSSQGAADNKAISYLYDGDQIIAEYDLSGTLQTKYIYGPGIDEPVLITKGGQNYYYHFDGLGSVTSLTNSIGSTVESYAYDAFGKPLIKNSSGTPLTASSIGNRYMFTGREYDAETGLYFYRARYYSPEIGRFLQTDPLEIDDENTYAYCYNDPANYIDPYGYQGIFLPAPPPYTPGFNGWNPPAADGGGGFNPRPPVAGGGGIPLGGPFIDGGWHPGPIGQPLPKPQDKPPVSTPPQGISENVTQGYATTGDTGKGGEKGDINKDGNKKPKPPKPKPDIRQEEPPSKPHHDKKTGRKEPKHWHYRNYNWDPNEEIWRPGKWQYGGAGDAPSN